MNKYLKVMFDTTSGANSDIKYKIGEVNVASSWNPNAKSGKNFGGFNYATEDCILRWLHRGDVVYDVEIPDDAENIKVEGATTIYRTNKIIIKNPRKITDEMALEFYKKSNMPELAYYKALGAVSLMNYKNTALEIFREKVNSQNIDIVLEEWNDFLSKGDRKDSNETIILISKLLNEVKSELSISISVEKTPYIKKITDDKVINLTGESGSGKSTYAKQYINDDSYIVIDTDEVFSRYQNSNGSNRKFGNYLRNKYTSLPSIIEDFDIIYNEILTYFKNSEKTIVIDSAQFRNLENLENLKGTIIVMRTSIDTCYNRCIERYKKNNTNATNEEIQIYKDKKKPMYKWYDSLNEFIKRIDEYVKLH